MILKVQVPAADAAFRAGYVATWHKKEGDVVEFGDHLCDIAIDEFMALQRTKRASLLGSTKKLRQRRIKDGYDHRKGRGLVHLRLTSSETGVVLGKILLEEGRRIEVGSVVGILSGPEEISSIDTEAVDSAAEARIVANMPDAAEIDPFD